MPYIPLDDRGKFELVVNTFNEIVAKEGISNGELNYLITVLGRTYLWKHGLSYNTGSDVVKALECAKLEFYARIMRPYEDKKMEQHGDVY